MHARRAAPALAILCALAIAQPLAARADNGLQAQLGVETWPALDIRSSADRGTKLDGVARASEIETRLWIGRGNTAFGIGTVMTDTPLAGPFSPQAGGPREGGGSSMVFGVRYQLANGSRLTLGSTAWPLSKADGAADNDVRLGLDLKPARSRKHFSRGTLFRAQLSEGTQLSLRVRSGGLRLVLRSEF